MIKEYINHPLRDLNSFHVEERAERVITFDQKEDLEQIFAEGHTLDNWYVLGGGNNILFTRRFGGTLIKPVGKNITIKANLDDSVIVEAEAGVEWDDMVEWSVERELWGMENLSLIPGTVGAAPVQNIGAYGAEAKDVIERVHYYDAKERRHHTMGNAECRFAYRESIFKHELRGKAIITSVEFRLSKSQQPSLGYGDLAKEVEARGRVTLKNIREAVCSIRRSKLPDTAVLGNAGSFFKNPIVNKDVSERLKQEYENMPVYPVSEQNCKLAAGWLIDQAGLKGYRQGNVGVHERQALVLVNFGGATGEEVISLSELVRERVKEKFGITIDPEVNIL
ncbi:MAG: UDP-N-acetylmuramate dehydrogenase [Rikenellaceae bacterium]|nr:UDP-N-acetylmuramate dehydrogenase [Rikenellaceae bacterium]MBQ8544736.1 UDP-N-acetylmuramate dehydrogenase [Alistipes sp.]